MTLNFLGGEGAIVERQLVDRSDKGAAVDATRGPGYRLEPAQEEAAWLTGGRRLRRHWLRLDAVNIEFEPSAALLGDDVVPSIGDVVPCRERVVAPRVAWRPAVQKADQARREK
jgi:hypothetical protein